MTVYIDSLFLINAAMDFLLIIITLKIRKRSFRLRRAVFASFAGGAFAAGIFFCPAKFPAAAVGLLFPALMLRAAYKPSSVPEFLKTLLIFYLSSCCMAGAGLLFFFSGKSNGFVKNGIFYMRLPPGTLVLSASVLYMLLSAAGYMLNALKKKHIVTLSVTHRSKRLTLTALEDSGNFLTEPISGKPVIVADKNILYIDGTETLFAVPFHSLGCEKGIIYAFKPERIEYKNMRRDALIGIYDGKLSPSGEYNALMGNLICDKKGEF
ncbi:MAG: sigma-E processing peptidase SpoIIGA [Oscillospiraceae bacterium]|nr:sigma-E processing peptidase SpoIIGA [Oscillospiraceae bacterium]